MPVQLAVSAKDSDLRGTATNYNLPPTAAAHAPSSTLATLSIMIAPPLAPAFPLLPGQSQQSPAAGSGGSHSRSHSLALDASAAPQHLYTPPRSGSRASASRHGSSSSSGLSSATSTSAAFMIRPGESATLTATVTTRRKGPLHFPFSVQLLGVVQVQAWEFAVSGFADDIMLPADLARLVTAEVLPVQRPIECLENVHLQKVLSAVDFVPSVSIRHELAVVEPLVSPASLQHKLAVPSPLTTTVLKTFKKWYHTRLPLKMTDRKDGTRCNRTLFACAVIWSVSVLFWLLISVACCVRVFSDLLRCVQTGIV